MKERGEKMTRMRVYISVLVTICIPLPSSIFPSLAVSAAASSASDATGGVSDREEVIIFSEEWESGSAGGWTFDRKL
ncbi:MAG: hypothetical protein AB1779_00780 [Candidatus Thermoplasmatota archaeon]